MDNATKLLLELIKGKLKRGDVTTIADGLNLSTVYVSRCLNPNERDYSEAVVEAAQNLIAGRNAKTKDRIKELSKL